MEAARGAAARRADEKRQRERDEADRAKALAEHVHRWRNWEYTDEYTTETRECKVCGATETRPLRPW